jgi:hypothetical protein
MVRISAKNGRTYTSNTPSVVYQVEEEIPDVQELDGKLTPGQKDILCMQRLNTSLFGSFTCKVTGLNKGRAEGRGNLPSATKFNKVALSC